MVHSVLLAVPEFPPSSVDLRPERVRQADSSSMAVTKNDSALTEHWFDIARSALDDDKIEETPEPFMGGEDFAYYAAHAPACFFLLGLRRPGDDDPAALHTPRFDFNDEAIPLGVGMFCRLALAEF